MSKTLRKTIQNVYGHRKLKLEHNNHKIVIIKLIEGHTYETINGIITKFELNPCINIKYIAYMSKGTNVRVRRPKQNMPKDRQW